MGLKVYAGVVPVDVGGSLGQIVEGGLSINILDVGVCSLLEEVLHEIGGALSQVEEGQSEQGTALLVLAVDVDLRVLKQSLDAALVVLEHGDVDWADLPGVHHIDV